MALKIKNKVDKINIEFSDKYNTYKNYIEHLIETYPEATKETITEFFNKEFNLLTPEAVKNSMEGDKLAVEKTKGLLSLEDEIKKHLLNFILGEDTNAARLTEKKLVNGLEIFRDIVERNKEKIQSECVFPKEKMYVEQEKGKYYKGAVYLEEKHFYLKIASYNGKVEKVQKKYFELPDKDVREVKLKTVSDGKSKYVLNKFSNEYVNIKTREQITYQELSDREMGNKQSVTLYEKIIKDIDLILKNAETDKSFMMKDYMGILELISFVTKDILQDENHILINSITDTPQFNQNDNRYALIPTYSNMVYGQGLEVFNMFKNSLENPNASLTNFDITGWNAEVEEMQGKIEEKGLEIEKLQLSSVDIKKEEFSEDGKTKKLSFVEVKHFTNNRVDRDNKNSFIVSLKRPRKINSKMAKLNNYSNLLEEVLSTEVLKVESETLYDITTYDEEGKVISVEIDMKDYIEFYKALGIAIKEGINQKDEEGNNFINQNGNFIKLNVKVNGINVGVQIERDKWIDKRLDLYENDIMEKSSKGIGSVKFAYDSNEDYVKLLEMFGGVRGKVNTKKVDNKEETKKLIQNHNQ